MVAVMQENGLTFVRKYARKADKSLTQLPLSCQAYHAIPLQWNSAIVKTRSSS